MSRVFCCVFLVFCLIGSAQDYEVTVTTVSVWVRTTDKSGKPVAGLKQADFEIFEDDQKVSPTCFEETNFLVEPETTSLQLPQSQPDQANDPNRKQVVFLMDLYSTSQTELLILKKKAAEFLEQVSKNWNITLVSQIPGTIHIDVENSHDASVIQEALNKMSANMMRDLDAINTRRDLNTALQHARGWPKKEQIPQLIDELCNRAREYAFKEKLRSKEWMESLKHFDTYIKKQDPGTHKVVLFFSGGISSSPGKQYFDMVRDSDFVREHVEDDFQMRRDYPSCDEERGLDLQKELKKLIGQLNRYNITFYTVSSRGPINELLETVRESDRKFNIHDLDFLKNYEDYLVLVADETGGVYFGNSLNFKRGFDTILNDLNHQYLICYKPPVHSKEGHHSIEVKIKQPGIKIRHREGYYD